MKYRVFLTILAVLVPSTVVSAQQPVVSGLFNVASFDPLVGPGTLAVAFGENLSGQPGFCQASVVPWPMDLCGVKAFVNDVQTPLTLATSGQVTLQIGSSLEPGPAVLVLEVNGRRSAPFNFELTTFAPGIFSVFGPLGGNLGLFLSSTGEVILPGMSVTPGDRITAMTAGLGPTSPTVPAGTIPPDGTIATTTAFPAARIGENPVLVLSSRLDPRTVGVYDVDLVVPWQQTDGVQDFMLTIGEVDSNTVQIPIGPGGVIDPVVQSVTNGASFAAIPLSPDSWADVWGASLGYFLKIDGTFPTVIEGTELAITDSQGTGHEARLHFVSWGRAQFLAPTGMASGTAQLSLTNSTGGSATLDIEVAAVSPGIFAANASGSGPAAATWLKVAGDGTRTTGLTMTPQLTNAPIDLGEPEDSVYLSFFGTGFRNQAAVNCTFAGNEVAVVGAVAQGQFDGLDQAVIGPVSRSFAGAGEVEVAFSFDGIDANVVTVHFK